MKEHGLHNHQQGDELIFYDRHERLTSQPLRSYANTMASAPSTPEHQTWDPIDELTQAAHIPQPASDASRKTLEEYFSARRMQEEVNLGHELTQQENDALRIKAAKELGFLGTNDLEQDGSPSPDPIPLTPEARRNTHPQLAMMQGGDDELTAEERKSFRNPRNLDEIMRSIADYEPEFHEEFPLFRKVGERINEKGKLEEVTEVNEANFLRWIRRRMRFFEGEEGPDTTVNYFSKIGVPFGSRHLHLGSLLEDDEKFFTDMNKGVHTELAQQIRRELFVRTIVRNRDITYRTGGKSMSDEEGISGILQSILKDNNMTRNTWNGKSMWHWLLEMPQMARAKPPGESVHDETEDRPGEGHESHGGHHIKLEKDYATQDTRLGQGIATAIAAYYHIADYTKLREMVGDNSEMFTRKGFEKVRSRLAKNEIEANPFGQQKIEDIEGKFISNAVLDEIFDQNDNIKNPHEFIKYMNFFGEAQVDPRKRDMVRGLITDAIGKKYKMYLRDKNGHYQKNDDGDEELDYDSLTLGEEYAFLTTRWTGIATRNDLGGTAYDAQAKWLRFKNYREKVADADRGGMFGNMYNAGMFKALGVNYMDSIRNQEGKLLREIIEEIATQVNTYEVKEGDMDEHGNLTSEAREGLKNENAKARQLLGQLTFPDLSEINLYNNGIYRWHQEYKSFIGAEELHLDKLVEQARFGGVLYDPAAFGKQIQEGFLKPLRYGYSSWPNLYDKTVRDIVEYDPTVHGENAPTVDVNKKKHVFVDMSLADSMFGQGLMDREHNWMRLPRYDEKGEEILDGKNSTGKVLEHVIDPKRINNDRIQMYKDMALGRIAADIYSHIDLNSPYPKWDGATITALINALEVIPGELLVDEHDLKNTMIPRFFFKREDIKWLRSIAHVSEKRRNTIDITRDTAKASWSVGRKFVSAFLKGIK